MAKVIPVKERMQAIELITEHLRELSSLTITIPLNNPVTKKIHTNMMIRTKFKTPKLQNMKEIGEIVKQTAQTRHSAYTENVWYVEKVEIENKPNSKTMKLTLNPFPVGVGSYADLLKSFREKQNTTSSTSKKKTAEKTKTSDIKLHDVDWFDKSDNDFIKEQVQKAIGTATTDLARAKNIDAYWKKYHTYSLYNGKPHLCSNSFRSQWGGSHNCGDGAVMLCAMFRCAGLDADILLTYDARHYIVQLKIDGQTYFTDHASCTGCYDQRGFNETWEGYRSGNLYNGRCE